MVAQILTGTPTWKVLFPTTPPTGTPPANRKSITGGCNNRHYNGQTLFILSLHTTMHATFPFHHTRSSSSSFGDLLTDGQRVYPRLSKWVSSFVGKWVGTSEYVLLLPTGGEVGCGCGSGGPELYPLMGKGSLLLHVQKQVGRGTCLSPTQ